MVSSRVRRESACRSKRPILRCGQVRLPIACFLQRPQPAVVSHPPWNYFRTPNTSKEAAVSWNVGTEDEGCPASSLEYEATHRNTESSETFSLARLSWDCLWVDNVFETGHRRTFSASPPWTGTDIRSPISFLFNVACTYSIGNKNAFLARISVPNAGFDAGATDRGEECEF